MARVESGPAKGERYYNLAIVAAALFFFGYFIYDWQIGYPNKNVSEAQKHLAQNVLDRPLDEASSVEIPDPQTPVQSEFEALQRRAGEQRLTPEDIRSAFGTPIHTDRNEEGYQREFYASHYGMATVTYRTGQPQIDWRKWYKSQSEVQNQLYFSFVPLLFALYFFYRFINAGKIRAVVDDEGLVYHEPPKFKHQRVPFEAMTALRDYKPKGLIDLFYKTDGEQKRLRFDNQKIAKFDEVVAAICDEKGFPNEVQKYQEQKAAEEAATETEQPAAANVDQPEVAEQPDEEQKS